MGESEAKSIFHESHPDPKAEPAKFLLARAPSRLLPLKAEKSGPQRQKPERWTGDTTALGDKIIDEHRAELLARTITLVELFRQELPKWYKIGKKGRHKRFSVDSMRKLVRGRHPE